MTSLVQTNKPVVPFKASLSGAFGKVCAMASLAATVAVYVGACELGSDVYQQYQETQNSWAQSTSQVLAPKPGHMTWGEEGAAFALSLTAGFAGIALGRRKKKYITSYNPGYSGPYYYHNDGFWDGYFIGSMFNGSSSSSSSSSDDGAGLAAALAIGALVVAAGTAAVVSYKAVRANFGMPC